MSYGVFIYREETIKGFIKKYPEAKKILEEAKDEFAYELPEKTFEYGG